MIERYLVLNLEFHNIENYTERSSRPSNKALPWPSPGRPAFPDVIHFCNGPHSKDVRPGHSGRFADSYRG
jgi:hypothetical protein